MLHFSFIIFPFLSKENMIRVNKSNNMKIKKNRLAFFPLLFLGIQLFLLFHCLGRCTHRIDWIPDRQYQTLSWNILCKNDSPKEFFLKNTFLYTKNRNVRRCFVSACRVAYGCTFGVLWINHQSDWMHEVLNIMPIWGDDAWLWFTALSMPRRRWVEIFWINHW